MRSNIDKLKLSSTPTYECGMLRVKSMASGNINADRFTTTLRYITKPKKSQVKAPPQEWFLEQVLQRNGTK